MRIDRVATLIKYETSVLVESVIQVSRKVFFVENLVIVVGQECSSLVYSLFLIKGQMFATQIVAFFIQKKTKICELSLINFN